MATPNLRNKTEDTLKTCKVNPDVIKSLLRSLDYLVSQEIISYNPNTQQILLQRWQRIITEKAKPEEQKYVDQMIGKLISNTTITNMINISTQINNITLEQLACYNGIDNSGLSQLSNSSCEMFGKIDKNVLGNLHGIIVSYTSVFNILYKTLIKNVNKLLEKCPENKQKLLLIQNMVESGLFSIVSDRCNCPKCPKSSLGETIEGYRNILSDDKCNNKFLLLLVIAFLLGFFISKKF